MLRLILVALLALQFSDASQPRVCYSCEGIQCQIISKQNQTVTCADLLDVCVTVFDEFAVSERGCLSSLSHAAQTKCESKDQQCLECVGNLCNNLGRSDYKCLQCIGSESSACNLGESASSSVSQCGLPTSPNAYCYVKVVGENLQRGCALSVKEQKTCLDDTNCSLCSPGDTEGACNSFDLQVGGKSSGAKHFLSLSLVALIALLVLQS
ncbi:uncharacterized protein Dwil_GK15645 [Drosophila willistoni]|uniref:DUF753 domain-containing protein n=1 Tax=Drosophila willistoni TaxID=7260 RepID=B4MS22_DROWI|nr:uncharacterized protein LOC6640957 [Drosophila willistoni]EDW74911.1 uncharacterized protein Dwil_GK15645 [Drosophila willistoni]